MIDAINDARSVVNVEMFNFASNGSGRAVADALAGAVRRGVEVNIVVDQAALIGIPPLGTLRIMRRLQSLGANVVFNGFLADAPGGRKTTHRKVVTVDGRRAFMGGINLGKLTDHYFDAMFELRGASAAALSADQARRWQEVGGAISSRHSATLRDARRGARYVAPEISLLTNAPHRRQFDLTNYYLGRIARARKRIWVSSPGYSDLTVTRALAAAARRGVDVRVVIPGKAPLAIPIITWNARANMREIIAAGGKVHVYPGVSHLKMLITDDEGMLGTYNATERSAKYDYEIGAISASRSVLAQMEQVMQAAISRSPRINLSDIRGIGQRMVNVVMDTFEPEY
jgi:cardiolipin synthase